MNIGGGFAGGLAQGLEAGQRMQMARSELDMRRQAFEEEREARKRAQAYQDEAAKIMAESYGEREVVDGESLADDGGGNIVKVPRVKKVKTKLGDNAAYDIGVFSKIYQAGFKYGKSDPKEIIEYGRRMDELRKTEFGNMTSKMLAGDPAALKAFLEAQGHSAEGAKLEVNPEKFVARITFSDGRKPVDIKRAVAANASADFYKMHIQAPEDRVLEVSRTQAQIARDKAQANSANATAGLAGTQKQAIIDETERKNLGIQMGSTFPSRKDLVSGSEIPHPGRLFADRMISIAPSGTSARAVYGTAIDVARTAEQEVVATMSGLSPQQKSALMNRFGARDDNDLHDALLTIALKRAEASFKYPQATNVRR